MAAWTFPQAYTFHSTLSLEGIEASLNAQGPWRWRLRNSEDDGPYLCSHPTEGAGELRILIRGSWYLLDTTGWTHEERSLTRGEIEELLWERIFPEVGAQQIYEIEGLRTHRTA
jgi:hypothetical protein